MKFTILAPEAVLSRCIWDPGYTCEVDAAGAIRLLDAIKDLGIKPRFYQASTSELFGGFEETVPQRERTPFYPRTPYLRAKVYSYWMTVNYRESLRHARLERHPLQPRIAAARRDVRHQEGNRALARIKAGLQKKLCWATSTPSATGVMPRYVEAMWLMLQQDKPDDFVIATGAERLSIRHLVETAFKEVGILVEWRGKGIVEKGVDAKSGRTLVEVEPIYFRPTEVEFVCGVTLPRRGRSWAGGPGPASRSW